MKASDFSQPRRMSGSAYVVLLVKALRQYASVFLIIILINAFKTDGQRPLLETVGIIAALVGCYLGLAAVTAFVGYYFRKYYMEDGKLIFIHGLFSKETTSIPLDRVQSLRTRQGFVYRLLDMRGVLFDTLASQSAEIELILDESDWNALLSRVETQERTQENKGPEVEADGEPGTRLIFSNWNLIKGALCQNHLQGMAVLFAALAAFYNTVTTVDDRAVDHVIDYVDAHAGSLSFQPSVWLAVAAVLYLVILLLWIGKVFLRYSNMEVRMASGQLLFESGLIARNSNRFRHDKVCTVYVKRNFLEKRLHGSTIVLKQALNATDEKVGADVRIYGSDAAADFLGWWLGKGYGDSPEIISARSGYGLMGHVVWLDLLISLVATVVLLCSGLWVWITLPAAWLLVSLVKGLLAVRRSCLILKEDYLEISAGRFADIHNYVKYSNVEVVRLVSTPFTPYFHRVRLTLSTNGTSFTIRSLKEQEAKNIYDWLLVRCGAGRMQA